MGKRTRKTLPGLVHTKSQHEIEFEASLEGKKITGPYEKEWDNYGVP